MPKALCRFAVAVLLVAATGCGAVGTATGEASPSPSAEPSSSQSPTPSKVFTFLLNPADSTVTSKGTITLTAAAKTTTVELKITGLQASSSHISHIHLGSCSGRGGIAFGLKQVVADGQGNADAKTTFSASYPPTTGRWYAVVHSGPDMQGTNSKYLLCGNLF